MVALGPASVVQVVDLDRFALPLGFLFPGAEIEALRDAAAWLAPHSVDFETGEVLLAVQSHVIRINGRTILVDACVGEDKPRPRRPDWHARRGTGWLDRLAAAGVRPEEVDVVFCTHLHADHIGWNTRMENGRWVPTFPNARYLVGDAELSHWRAEEARAPGEANHAAYADSVLPVIEAGLMETVSDGAELAPGLTVMPLPGHSPGQAGLELAHRGGGAVFCADALHSPAQLRRPDWCSAFCADPDGARATRADLLARAEAEGLFLIPAHLRGALGFRVSKACGDGWRPEYA